jgi:hypothetical protein
LWSAIETLAPRYPSAETLIAIDKRYGISPRDLDADAIEFAARLADPDRMMATTRDRVEAIKRRQGDKVVPIEKGRSRRQSDEVPPPGVEPGRPV